MNFNSLEYSIFLPVVVIVAMYCRRSMTARNLFLLVASYYFYMSWDWRYAGLIAISTMIDYVVGLGLNLATQSSIRKLLLVVSLTVNLGLLATFKYFGFFVDVIEQSSAHFGGDWSLPHLHFLLPVGISFYTFQTLSYTIDVFRRQIKYEPSLLRFALYVSFFPQLVAGPIVRARDFLPQLRAVPMIHRAEFNRGLLLIFRGLLKKVVLADLLAALLVDDVFADPAMFSSWDLYFALCGYAYQIYNDFSGYSDIAIGSAKLLGFDLPINFDRPYMAQNVREFWSRWHISLSTWLRDYLYIPLGGNRHGVWRTKFNLMATMVLGGLWHGAATNFVVWGFYHGVLLVLSHTVANLQGVSTHPLPAWFKRVLCFHLVLIGWLLFRVESFSQFTMYVDGMVKWSAESELSLLAYVVLAASLVAHFFPKRWIESFDNRFLALPSLIHGLTYAALILFLVGCTLETPSFIYFQF